MPEKTTMRAHRLRTREAKWTIETVPIPVPGPDQVLIKVAFCGICHSDLSFNSGAFEVANDQTSGSPLRRVPEVVTSGHEVTGTIAALGPGVTGWEIGDRVIAPTGQPDHTCEVCRTGVFEDCPNLEVLAVTKDGGWAEYVLSRAIAPIRIPDSLPLDQAAIIPDALSTPYGAVVNTGQVKVGEAVGVWGIGGVGTHLVQVARLVGANPIIAFDISEETRQRALDRGADFAFDSRDPDLEQKVMEATGGHMFDVTFDAVGIKPTFTQALAFTRNRGRMIAVGETMDEVSIGTTLHFGVSRKQVRGHLGCPNEDVEALVKLVAAGRLDVSQSISNVVSLENLADGIDQLHHHTDNPIRILVNPNL
ncbi:zinc-binding dehydrogenase [Herbiconiux daphne]|uniref:Zinc-binding dehydrogenase n=1 Tax=Herbiconiux daphne TaxID=2970914 RepID=A0ABT2H3P2_9MICO|nr:zinc-binding dehydrogenase [Herbiconiux daphne]MCS5734550.1 zinc-binding dehydrogenase [Herbiconiux daphne]